MKEDLDAIYKLLIQNKEKVASLQAQLKKRGPLPCGTSDYRPRDI